MKKTITPSTSSSLNSMSTGTTEEERSERRDSSCYFPGCRKDANCSCDICLASINATLDLMPLSTHRSSFTKLSASKPIFQRTPICFNPAILSTPRTIAHHISDSSPDPKSTAKSSRSANKKRKGPLFIEFGFWRFFLGMSLIFAAEFGSPWMVSKLIQPIFSIETVRNMGRESWVVKDMNGRLDFLQKNLGKAIKGKVSNCKSLDSVWKLNLDGLLLSSRCVLYKSAAEEVSIWGWPLQTAGLLTTGFASRSFIILTGRVTEWSEGKIGFSTRKANSSWVQRRWRASTVQLDPNTWVLEYRESSILENPRLFSAALDFLKFRTWRTVEVLKQKFWFLPVEDMKQQFWRLLPVFAQHYSYHTTQESNSRYPT